MGRWWRYKWITFHPSLTKAAATLFDVMNTRAFFRSPSHKIAEFAAGEIGEKEHLKASEQYSYGA
ncbi:hypothetical protein ACNI0N_28155, partial [Escherichia coli]